MNTSAFQNTLAPLVVFMAVTGLNIVIMTGLSLNITLGITSTQIFVLGALEMAVVLLVYKESRRKKTSLSC